MTNHDDEQQPEATTDEPAAQERREFLRSLGKWSQAVIGGVVAGGALIAAEPAEAWDGSSWYNRPGGWYNRHGGWYNRHGGGGWYNRHGGGGWYNRHGGWYNRGGGGGWYNRHGGWYNRGGGGGWYNR